MNAIVKFDPSKLVKSFKRIGENMPVAGSFLKLTKGGEWIYGTDENPVGSTDRFVVNPRAVKIGWVCWADTDAGHAAAKLGEVMQDVQEGPPEKPAIIPPTGKEWTLQMSIQLKGVTGKVAGVDLTYSTNSYGGVNKGIRPLVEAMGEHLSVPKNLAKMNPVVTLDSESYKHAKYGRLFNPVITIVDWMADPVVSDTKKVAKKK